MTARGMVLALFLAWARPVAAQVDSDLLGEMKPHGELAGQRAPAKRIVPPPRPTPTPTPVPQDDWWQPAPVVQPSPPAIKLPPPEARWKLFTLSGTRLDRGGAINHAGAVSYKWKGLLEVAKPTGWLGLDQVGGGATMFDTITAGVSYDFRSTLPANNRRVAFFFGVAGFKIAKW